MSVQESALPDLTIWDSVRDCASSALTNLVSRIESEISKDQTLADLRTTGSARMALESRARNWMVRAYACCLECWVNGGKKEESDGFRAAVYLYGLSPFFSRHILRLLRLAAGLPRETITQLEVNKKPCFNNSEVSALHNASEVYTKLMTSWIQDLPPITNRASAENTNRTPVASQAFPPPDVLRGGGWIRTKPKPVELPTSFPPAFPRPLVLKATVILADVIREFPDRSKLETLCKELVFRYTELLCAGVCSALLKAYEAPDELNTIVHSVLVANCERENERFEIQQAVINSDEWHAMLKRLLECQQDLQPSDARATDSAKTTNPTRQRIDTFLEKLREHGHPISRKDIWQAAGYGDATEFERFQRENPRVTAGSRARFERILNMDPQEFVQKLEKLDSK